MINQAGFKLILEIQDSAAKKVL